MCLVSWHAFCSWLLVVTNTLGDSVHKLQLILASGLAAISLGVAAADANIGTSTNGGGIQAGTPPTPADTSLQANTSIGVAKAESRNAANQTTEAKPDVRPAQPTKHKHHHH